jgi:hypothetical protein
MISARNAAIVILLIWYMIIDVSEMKLPGLAKKIYLLPLVFCTKIRSQFQDVP